VFVAALVVCWFVTPHVSVSSTELNYVDSVYRTRHLITASDEDMCAFLAIARPKVRIIIIGKQ